MRRQTYTGRPWCRYGCEIPRVWAYSLELLVAKLSSAYDEHRACVHSARPEVVDGGRAE